MYRVPFIGHVQEPRREADGRVNNSQVWKTAEWCVKGDGDVAE